MGLLIAGASLAQDAGNAGHPINFNIPEVFAVDIEGEYGTSIVLTPSFSGEAGEGLDFSDASDNTLWLNYISIIPQANRTRNISVEVDNVSLPRGLRLFLRVSEPTGFGNLGDARNSRYRLRTNRSTNIISGIGTCYTGDGFGKGSQLEYFLLFNNNRFDELTELNTTITVTYTISD